METRNYCAYNVTRNALLCEKVTPADTALGSMQILGLMMHGPGADNESGVWLTGLSATPQIPRLFAFDILYLDKDHHVIGSGEVGPGTDFPSVEGEVASALILPDRRLSTTLTANGDLLRFCNEAELAATIKAASDSFMEVQQAPPPLAADALTPTPPPADEPFRPSEFVFEPFAGSLLFIPTVHASHRQMSELFLPQSTRFTPPEIPPTPAPEELPVAETLASPQTFASPETLASPQTLPSPLLGDVDIAPPAPPEPPVPKPARKEPEVPHFYHPEPFRFFDPAAATDSASETQPAQEEIVSPRPSLQLPPELKAAILQIDEQRRRLQNEAKEKPAKKKKIRAEKSKQPKPSDADILHVVPASEIPVAPPEPPTVLAAEATATIAEPIQPVSATPVLPAPEVEVATPVADHPTAPPPSVPAPIADEPPIAHTAPPPAPAEIEEPMPVPVFESIATPAFEDEDQPAHEDEYEPQFEPPVDEPLPAFVQSAYDLETDALTLNASTEFETETEDIPQAPVAMPEEISTFNPFPEPIESHAPYVIEEEPVEIQEPERPRKKPRYSFATRIQRWLDGEAPALDGRRRSSRISLPGLVAFYWSGGTPRPHEILNISKDGFYMRTKEVWSPDTLVRMTLQRSHDGPDHRSISILARVVRVDDEGVGHEFVTTDILNHLRTRDVLPEHGTDRKQLEDFLR